MEQTSLVERQQNPRDNYTVSYSPANNARNQVEESRSLDGKLAKRQGEVGTKMTNLMDKMNMVMDLGIPREKYPGIVLEDPEEKGRDSSGYSPKKNVITMLANSVEYGDVCAEEVAHFFRNKLRKGIFKKSKEDERVAEFYGFLGRRLYGRMSETDPELMRDFPKVQGLDVASVMGSKKELLGWLRKARAKEREIKEEYGGRISKYSDEEIKKMAEELVEVTLMGIEVDRASKLWHYTGYEWASKFDLSKVNDWRKLFSLKTSEARKRFFRPEPDYSGL